MIPMTPNCFAFAFTHTAATVAVHVALGWCCFSWLRPVVAPFGSPLAVPEALPSGHRRSDYCESRLAAKRVRKERKELLAVTTAATRINVTPFAPALLPFA